METSPTWVWSKTVAKVRDETKYACITDENQLDIELRAPGFYLFADIQENLFYSLHAGQFSVSEPALFVQSLTSAIFPLHKLGPAISVTLGN